MVRGRSLPRWKRGQRHPPLMDHMLLGGHAEGIGYSICPRDVVLVARNFHNSTGPSPGQQEYIAQHAEVYGRVL